MRKLSNTNRAVVWRPQSKHIQLHTVLVHLCHRLILTFLLQSIYYVFFPHMFSFSILLYPSNLRYHVLEAKLIKRSFETFDNLSICLILRKFHFQISSLRRIEIDLNLKQRQNSINSLGRDTVLADNMIMLENVKNINIKLT